MYSVMQDVLLMQNDQLRAEILAAQAENARLRARLADRLTAETVTPKLPTLDLAQALDWLGNRGVVTYRNGAAFELLAHYNGVLYARVKSPQDVKALAADTIVNSTQNALLTEHWDQYGVLFENRTKDDEICSYMTHYINDDSDDDDDDDSSNDSAEDVADHAWMFKPRIKQAEVIECNRAMTRAQFDALALPAHCLLVDAPRNALC